MNYDQLKARCQGVQAILVTPFKESFELDEEGLRRNVRFLTQNGIRFVTSMGTVSEFYSLSLEEQKIVIRAVVEEASHTEALVIMGASSTSTRTAIELSQYAEKCGAQGVMVAPPFYLPLSPKEVIAHFQAISEEIDIGLVIYYYPQLHRAPMNYEVFAELASLKNVIGVKWCELDLHPFTSIFRRLNHRMAFISGYGEHLAPYTYMIGVKAISSSIANYAPQFSLELHRAAMQGKWLEVAQLALRTFSLYDFAIKCGAGIAIVKEAMNLVGLAAGPVRPPGRSLTSEERTELAGILADLGALKEVVKM